MCNWVAQKSLQVRSSKDGQLGAFAYPDVWYEYDDNDYLNAVEWYDYDGCSYEQYGNEMAAYSYENNEDTPWETEYPEEDWEICAFRKGQGKGKQSPKGKGKEKGDKRFHSGKRLW